MSGISIAMGTEIAQRCRLTLWSRRPRTTGDSLMKTDAQLQHDVLQELKWDASVDETHIGISAKDGVITLTGHVPSYGEKYAAEKAAKRVSGVKAIANEIDVKLPGS